MAATAFCSPQGFLKPPFGYHIVGEQCYDLKQINTLPVRFPRGFVFRSHSSYCLRFSRVCQVEFIIPYDNAFAESLIKTLKAEEVHCNEYETLEQAQADIGHFLAFIYNGKRLHSALGYRPPEEFEAAFAAEQAAAGSQARVGDAEPVGDALRVGT